MKGPSDFEVNQEFEIDGKTKAAFSTATFGMQSAAKSSRLCGFCKNVGNLKLSAGHGGPSLMKDSVQSKAHFNHQLLNIIVGFGGWVWRGSQGCVCNMPTHVHRQDWQGWWHVFKLNEISNPKEFRRPANERTRRSLFSTLRFALSLTPSCVTTCIYVCVCVTSG